MEQYIRKALRENLLNENVEIWYHGSPDVSQLERDGGFTHKSMSIEYINNIEAFNQTQEALTNARESGNEDEYFKILDTVPQYKSKYNMRKPVFLTDKFSVAQTYADSSRIMYNQDAIEGVIKVAIDPGKLVRISAPGDRFRFIDVNKVRRGFVRVGVNEDDFNQVFSAFNFYVRDKSRIKTDMIAAIGHWFEIDTIDVDGVLDSYHGGSVRSTVRMVLDPTRIKLIK